MYGLKFTCLLALITLSSYTALRILSKYIFESTSNMADSTFETRVPTPISHEEEDKAVHEEVSADSVETLSINAAAALTGDQTKALKIHNDGRKTKGCPALTWDAGLAQHAQQWANHLAKIDKLEHSTGAQRPGEGENLAW